MTEKCRTATNTDLVMYLLVHAGQRFFQKLSENEKNPNTLSWCNVGTLLCGITKFAINKDLCEPIRFT